MKAKSCFIIMPFTETHVKGEHIDQKALTYIYTNIIKRAVAEYTSKNKPVFSDIARYESNIGSIISGIVNNLNESDLIIADLTGLNPNVMYELGVRHTLKRGTIIITQDLKSLPSDLRDYTCLDYKFSQNTIEQTEFYEDFRDKLHVAITELFSTDKFDSPVLNYLKGKERYWREDEIKKIKENIIIGSYIVDQYEIIKDILSIIAESKDKAVFTAAFARVSAVINNIASAISQINISFETAILYENTQAALLLIGEVQKRLALTDYFANYIQALAGESEVNFESLKVSFFNDKYIDYFKLNDGEFEEISFSDIFNDEGDFTLLFLSDFEEFLEKRAIELGLSKEEIDFMLQN